MTALEIIGIIIGIILVLSITVGSYLAYRKHLSKKAMVVAEKNIF